ncbi:MAG TPA: hypothetical protein VI172_14690 [Candidatus Dormibacteraeota bacterium]|jgi:hypothetical protein
MNDTTEPTIQVADRIYDNHQQGLCSRAAAVEQMVTAYGGGLTTYGAAEMLDFPVKPSERRGCGAGVGKASGVWHPLRREDLS